MSLLQNAYVAQMVMHMCIICNPLVHLCKSIFFRCESFTTTFLKYSNSTDERRTFSLAVDGSNDNGIHKMNPVTVRIYDSDTGHIGTGLLDMCLTTDTGSATAASVFTAMNNALESRGIPWTNCVSLSVDNT